jgi:hypothetical protein
MDLHMIKLFMVLIEPMLNLITLKGVIFLIHIYCENKKI